MDIEQVNKIAKLARLKLDEHESKKILNELEKILDYMSVLQKTNNPTQDISSESENLFEREDQAVEQADIAKNILKQAPHEVADSFGVPKIIGG